MPNSYTAITQKDGDWWIGWIEEIPGVNCQERTREELLESLKAECKTMMQATENQRLACDSCHDLPASYTAKRPDLGRYTEQDNHCCAEKRR